MSPTKVGDEGWVGRAIRDIDPQKENVLTGVNFGRGLPRALAAPGVPVASVGNLETYGVLTGIEAEDQRLMALETFSRTYSPMLGKGPVLSYFAQTGLDALKGADILSTALENYSSTVKYGGDDVGAIHEEHRPDASGGPRDADTLHHRPRTIASIPTPENWRTIPSLWSQTSQAISAFYDDLKEHNATDNVVLFVFTEFGRRVHDNGSGTDHGAGGHAFVIGDAVKGGLYGEYPSLEPEKLHGRRSPLQQRLPRHLRYAPGAVVGSGFQAHSGWHVRAA